MTEEVKGKALTLPTSLSGASGQIGGDGCDERLKNEVRVGGVRVDLDQGAKHVLYLARRVDIVGAKAKEWILRGGVVAVKQMGPCSLVLVLENWGGQGRGWNEETTWGLAYPFPVNGEKAKLKIARKSGYVEVLVAMSGHKLGGGYPTHTRLPVNLIKTPSGTLVLSVWNVHRVNLDELPCLDVFDDTKLDTYGRRPLRRGHHRNSLEFLPSHLTFSLSERERAIRNLDFKSYNGVDVFIDLKDSIATMFKRLTGDKLIPAIRANIEKKFLFSWQA
ncbi:hypothetical protein BC829DRAFT_116251 [Chytridium lagenaria]|nr:hypothetical protein BC829DRAFT_116251 [Chytridium lagenaria]